MKNVMMMCRKAVIGMGFSLLALTASAGDVNTALTSHLSQGAPVYNQAYAENYAADNIDTIMQATATVLTDSFEAEKAKASKNAYVLVDPFMNGIAEKIPALQANGNEVGCYISIGTGENWRDDFDALKPYLVDKQWGEWVGEYFVKSTTTGILSLMKNRIDKLKNFACDWVEFDNMDWFTDEDYISEYGIEVTEAQGIDYYQELCAYAREQGIMCMAKNTVVGADDFSGVLYESYENEKNWWDSDGAQAFLDAGKLVIINHYGASNPDSVYNEYKGLYNDNISFISENTAKQGYVHYNQ